jgi:hypothetical protein
LKEIFVELRILGRLLLLKEAAFSLVLVGGEGLHRLFDLWDLDVALGDGGWDYLPDCC